MIRDACDVAYALLLEQVEKRTLAERQVVATLLGAGAKNLTMPDVDEAITSFDEALNEAPKATKRRNLVLLDALGVDRAS